jgi:hypothetical protein
LQETGAEWESDADIESVESGPVTIEEKEEEPIDISAEVSDVE